ncbi:MAG TPA: glutathione S-transferase family protein [Thermohalobaculum sp.]|nr:glutathione S-transferase family protein [Thermohalobaculum sp.]
MPEIILHNYPQSPVAEKVRVGLGIKRLAWASVEIPRIPPKPLLLPLTGGYRRTPVMQIGADIYCDSQCILREIERRHSEPTFFPGGADGMAWGVSRWTDGELFSLVIKVVLGAAGDALPRDFAEDRGRLYLGADWDEGLKRANADLPHLAAQVRAHFGWMDQRLATGRRFMLGDAAGLPDALAYHVVWFLRGRWEQGPAFLSEFPALEAWEARVRAIGHGTMSAMGAEDALAIAQGAEPQTAEQADMDDRQGLVPGMAVTVAPDLDGGEQAVAGVVQAVSRETVAILRKDPQVGLVCVHFPRVGYRVNRRPQ